MNKNKRRLARLNHLQLTQPSRCRAETIRQLERKLKQDENYNR